LIKDFTVRGKRQKTLEAENSIEMLDLAEKAGNNVRKV
jgi:hypothetical protein